MRRCVESLKIQSTRVPEHAYLVQVKARMAYADRDFQTAVSALSERMYQQPNNPKWSEMRAGALVDGKNFSAAIMDYNEAMQRTPGVIPCVHCHLLVSHFRLPAPPDTM
jgi:predicted Zn-dependent protease